MLIVPHSKGDYDGAIAQYIRTIGKLEPSYVIRKVSIDIVVGGDASRLHRGLGEKATKCQVMFLSLQFLDAQRIHNLTDYLKVCEGEGSITPANLFYQWLNSCQGGGGGVLVGTVGLVVIACTVV